MPLKGFLNRIRRLNSSGLPSSELPSDDECKEEHKKIFRPILDTLVKKITTKRRRFDLNHPSSTLVFLEDIGFLKELRSTYPNVELSIDILDDSPNGKLCLRGRGEEFDTACNKCSWKLREITKSSLSFEDKRIWDAIADTRVQEHVKSILTVKNIRAQVCAGDTGTSVIITAMDGIELRKARDVLVELIEIKMFSIPEHVDRYSKSEKIQKFLTEQEGSLPLKVYFHPSNVVVEIVGVAEAVTKAISIFGQFFESMRIKRQFFTGNRKLTPDVWTFLEMHFDEIKKAKEEKFLNLKVSVQLEKQPSGNHQISMTGIEESFPACNDIIEKLILEITQKDEQIAFPGLKKLFDGKIGKHELKRIETNWKVYIKIQSSADSSLPPAPQSGIPRSATVSHNATQSGYERCNFTTKEGVQLSCKIGRIENEKADVLVNSTLSNLNNPTACGKALQDRGGVSYIEVCKPHTNIPTWGIVCTTGGNLSCQYVIHAVCCNWNKDDKQKSEKALRDLIMKIFVKCVELGISSIAMPTIGAGKHGYPEDIVLKIILEEVERISSKNVCKIALRNVSVIVFEDKQSNYSGKMNSLGKSSLYFSSQRLMLPNMLHSESGPQEPPQQLERQLQQPLQPLSPQQPTPTDIISIKPGSSADLKFGSVSIVLKEGDITKQTADAILNVLPKTLKLLDGGGVCQSIMKTGSQTVQDELDQISRDSNLGSIFITSAGSIPNIKKIIHFVPTTTDVAGLQASIEQCFHSAQQHSLNHILIPAVGTANFNISPKSSARLILKAAKKFSETQNSLTVEIVVFLKKIFPDFNKAIEDQIEELATVAGLQDGQQNSGNTVTQAINNEVNNNSFAINGNSQDADNSNAAGTVEEIQLHFVGFKKNINDAISETKAFVDRNKDERSIENMGDIIQKHKSEVDKLSRIYRVRVKCSAGRFAVEGMKSDVAEFLVKFTEVHRKYEVDQQNKKWENKIDEQKKKLLREISQYVQWSYLSAGNWIPYDENINGKMETVFREDEGKILYKNINGGLYCIELLAMTMEDIISRQIFQIKRTPRAESSSDNLPLFWDEQPGGKVVHLVTLLSSSSEYKDILTLFKKSFGERTAPGVTKIERMQNPEMFRLYLAKTKSMEGRENEMRLFHGTDVKNTVAINGNNFNRSYAGINGTLYGDGVYFASNSSFALGYCVDKLGINAHSIYRSVRGRSTALPKPRSFQMYVVKVLVGDFTKGNKGMKQPPSKNDPKNPSLLFDSVVNDTASPTIFVIFQDHQCYPEYLITFEHV